MSDRRPRHLARALARALSLALLGLLVACGDGPPAARHVFLITCDTLRADRLGVYGNTRGLTPKLDAFAAGSRVFQSAYSCAPVTGPALSSLMAGRIPDLIGMAGGNGQVMPSQVETLAEIAGEAGFTTGAFVSNWVLRRPRAMPKDLGLPQGFDTYNDEMTSQELNRPNLDRLAPDTTDDTLSWIDRQLGKDRDQLFVWVHYQDPHGPYTPPDGYAALYESEPVVATTLPAGETVKGLGQIPSYQLLGDERRAHVYEDRYDAEVAYFDDALGRLLDGLFQRGLLKDALVVLSADHGESLGEHDYWFCHGENVYREQVAVPLIVRWPEGLEAPPAGIEPRVASHLDVFPTVLDALGLPPRETLGLSLREALPRDRFVPHSLGEPGTRKRWYGMSGERVRLVVDEGEPPRLFNLSFDPGETQDLSGEQPAIAAALDEQFRLLLDPAATLESIDRAMSEEDKRAFLELGYTVGDEDG